MKRRETRLAGKQKAAERPCAKAQAHLAQRRCKTFVSCTLILFSLWIFSGLILSTTPIKYQKNNSKNKGNYKAFEHWGLRDNLTMMQRLGAITIPMQEPEKENSYKKELTGSCFWGHFLL